MVAARRSVHGEPTTPAARAPPAASADAARAIAALPERPGYGAASAQCPLVFCLLVVRPPSSPLFPYTTLFRSDGGARRGDRGRVHEDPGCPLPGSHRPAGR